MLAQLLLFLLIVFDLSVILVSNIKPKISVNLSLAKNGLKETIESSSFSGDSVNYFDSFFAESKDYMQLKQTHKTKKPVSKAAADSSFAEQPYKNDVLLKSLNAHSYPLDSNFNIADLSVSKNADFISKMPFYEGSYNLVKQKQAENMLQSGAENILISDDFDTKKYTVQLVDHLLDFKDDYKIDIDTDIDTDVFDDDYSLKLFSDQYFVDIQDSVLKQLNILSTDLLKHYSNVDFGLNQAELPDLPDFSFLNLDSNINNLPSVDIAKGFDPSATPLSDIALSANAFTEHSSSLLSKNHKNNNSLDILASIADDKFFNIFNQFLGPNFIDLPKEQDFSNINLLANDVCINNKNWVLSADNNISLNYEEDENFVLSDSFKLNDDLQLLVKVNPSITSAGYTDNSQVNQQLSMLNSKYFNKIMQQKKATQEQYYESDTEDNFDFMQQNDFLKKQQLQHQHPDLKQKTILNSKPSTDNDFDSNLLFLHEVSVIANKEDKNPDVNLEKKVAYDSNRFFISLKDKIHLILESHFRSMLAHSCKTAEIRLDPPNLGSINISLELDANNEVKRIDFFAKNQKTKELIDFSLDKLKDLLVSGKFSFSGFKGGSKDQGGRDQKSKGMYFEMKEQAVAKNDTGKMDSSSGSDSVISLYV